MEDEGVQMPQIGVTVPLFLKKLWKMVNDKEAEDIIGWNSTGDGFIIYDQVQFITQLLPKYFKHNNMASFIRQLNFYDFHKIASIDKEEIQFAHNCFLKDVPETLVFIKRKCTNVKSKISTNIKQAEITELLNGVKEIKNKHLLVDNELKSLKQENAALWSEINTLRAKHSKQTKIINKLIHFLISYMHSHQNSLTKRGGSISRQNPTKNLKTGPTILEIAYPNSHNTSDIPKESQQNSYTVTEPETIYTIAYKSKSSESSSEQPSVASSIEEILPSIETPVSSPDNLESQLPLTTSAAFNIEKPFNILENPRESLGLHIDNNQFEINSLQEILANLTSSDISSLDNFWDSKETNLDQIGGSADLANICQGIQDEQIDPLESMSQKTKKELVEELATLPGGSNLPGIENDNIDKQFTPENVIPEEVVVDEYFNPDF